MRALVCISFILLFTNCQVSTEISEEPKSSEVLKVIDTIIGSKPIHNEIAGSAYRKRATAYYVIIASDTSNYAPIFSEAKEGGKVSLDLNIPYFNNSLSMRQRMEELKLILPKASLDYNFDSLTWISVGRLVLTGDLAMDVTEEYRNKFGKPKSIRTSDYKEISEFLKESKLGRTFNTLFQPFALSVDRIGIEKVFFTNKKQMLSLKLTCERDSLNYPDEILDCITSVKLKKE